MKQALLVSSICSLGENKSGGRFYTLLVPNCKLDALAAKLLTQNRLNGYGLYFKRFEQIVKFVPFQRFFFYQSFGDFLKRLFVAKQNPLGNSVGAVNERSGFFVYLLRHFFGIIFLRGHFSAQKDESFGFAESHRPEFCAHSVSCDHVTGEFRGMFKVV